MSPNFPPAEYIQTDAALYRLIEHLRHERLVAIDTESNSLYVYRERVCLLQISTRDADYIVDPLARIDLAPFGRILADEGVQKVFHAAEYDLMCLKRDFGFQVRGLFDTMVAARICGRKQIGLHHLVSEFTGMTLDKSHQRDDWGKRPLPDEGLRYAQMDTHFLPLIHDRLSDELRQRDRWTEALEAFDDLCGVPPAVPYTFDPDGFWKIALPNQLTRRQAAVLRELYTLREEAAKARNLPPFKILSDKTLSLLAVAQPRALDQLRGIEGMSAVVIERIGKGIIEAVERGLHAKLPSPPAPNPPDDPVVVERYTALREWRKQRAAERGVESDVIISKEALWQVAEKFPTTLDEMRDIRGLGPWRLAAYGQQILDVLHKTPTS